LSATVTFRNDLETIQEIHNITNQIYATVKDVPDLEWIFFYVPQPKIIESHAAKRGGNILGLAADPTDEVGTFPCCRADTASAPTLPPSWLSGAKHSRAVTFIVPRWEESEYDEQMYAAARQWVEQVEAATARRGTSRPFKYVNFAWDFQTPLCDYGAESVALMKQVAAKYDPNRVFQELVPGGFKLTACGY
jgi:hypothetical protein